MRKIVFICLGVLILSMILIPLIFNLVFSENTIINESDQFIEMTINEKSNIQVGVYREATDTIEQYSLEEYVRGVVAAEMPINFQLEALKAQAIAARTYIVKIMVTKDYAGLPEGAMVTDTTKHQVLLSDLELKRNWGSNYSDNISKLNQVINETEGQVIVYNNQPIDALYFSTSNGYTENSEDYWQIEVPYLKSVASTWDQESPMFQASKTISFDELKNQLGIDPSIASTTNQKWIEIISMTDGNRVEKIKIGDFNYSGREIREYFNLNSSDFTIDVTEDGITFYTRGFGHGVGMSQYGANGQAKEGNSADDIIKYYYTDVEIRNIEEWIKE